MSIKRILISQPAPAGGKSPYYDIAAKHKAEVTFHSFFSIESVSSREFRNQKINILDHSAIVFTSRKAMEHFFSLIEEMRITMPESMKYFCVNEQVANYLQKWIVYRKRKVFFPQVGGQQQLVELIQKHNKENYFIPVSEDHTSELPDMLSQRKVKFTLGVMYRTVPNGFPEGERPENYDLIIFFSPAGLTSLKTTFPDFEQGKIKFGAFGTITSQFLEEEGYKLDIVAPREGVPSMATALELYLEGKKK